VGAGERPSDHGLVVHNSQTLFPMHRLLTTGRTQTTKHVQVYGETPCHSFVEAPVGTLAELPTAAVQEPVVGWPRRLCAGLPRGGTPARAQRGMGACLLLRPVQPSKGP
jgi:hypothetical protein